MPWHIKGSKISLTENEWLVCNMLDMVFCGVTEPTTENTSIPFCKKKPEKKTMDKPGCQDPSFLM